MKTTKGRRGGGAKTVAIQQADHASLDAIAKATGWRYGDILSRAIAEFSASETVKQATRIRGGDAK